VTSVHCLLFSFLIKHLGIINCNGESNENFKLCAAVGTACHQCGLQACTVCGISGVEK
jgi:hypothetical protein